MPPSNVSLPGPPCATTVAFVSRERNVSSPAPRSATIEPSPNVMSVKLSLSCKRSLPPPSETRTCSSGSLHLVVPE